MKLYLNGISSASSRVRIALALKGLTVETQSVGILGEDAESRQSDFRAINPQGLVPALLTDDGVLITQSLAIIEYLDELQPEPLLVPKLQCERALARSIAMAIAAEIHALLPPRIALYLTATFQADANSIAEWNRHWLREGLTAIEKLLADHRHGAFSIGNEPSIADIFLFPQSIGATRLGLDPAGWPNILDVVTRLGTLPAFAENAPAARK